MQVSSYGKLLEEVEKLNQAEQLRLLEQIAVLIRSKATVKTRRSILELQGMGKNMWKDIDAQKYVDNERASWNG
jgi:predicted transposase YdaD